MLLRLYNDETPLIDHSQARRNTGPAPDGAEKMVIDTEAEPETIVDEDGGVKLNADGDEDMESAETTVPTGENGVDDSLAADKAAPERVGESDEFNKTV